MLREEIDKLIGHSEEEPLQTVDYAIRTLLVMGMDYSNALTDPQRPDEHFRCWSAQSVLLATCARLMYALQDEENPTDVAWEVVDAIGDGMDMHVWMAGQLSRLGIQVPAETSPIRQEQP